MAATSKKNKGDRAPKSFEILMEELEKIVTQLEGGELALEESIELFEKGMRLAAEGLKKLDAAEKKVEMLLQDNGEERTVPFLPEDEDKS